ncbi:VF530 family protein [Pseudomonas citronellolis]|uniref:VF530 family protein n=1 Tax=Pseudomonas citronellolis TaxID=53408 RepID=UPI0021138DC9|nr:VF530 family protein [Pseudomonas citronellolis]UUC48438.1 VF530 family protein [Pseudomonas citronellolis]
MSERPKDPLHGMTLQTILERLLEQYGWEGLAKRIDIRCFKSEPSIKSSLTFLRRTPWAREQVEKLYVQMVRGKG